MDCIIQITWRGGKTLISWFPGIIQLLVFKKVSGILWGDRLETWHWLVCFSSNVPGNPFYLVACYHSRSKTQASQWRWVYFKGPNFTVQPVELNGWLLIVVLGMKVCSMLSWKHVWGWGLLSSVGFHNPSHTFGLALLKL